MKQKTLTSIGMILCLCTILFVSIPQTQAQFVLSTEYSYSNGNGIYNITVTINDVENYTMYYDPNHPDYGTANNLLTLTEGDNVTLTMFCWLNGTYVDISSFAEGLNAMRLSIIVRSAYLVMMSQEGLAFYDTGIYDYWAPMYLYKFYIDFDFDIVGGNVYSAIITYELDYGD